MNIPPASEFLEFLIEKVESGEYPSEEAVWLEAMRRFRHSEEIRSAAVEDAVPTDPIDFEAIADCESQIAGRDIPSIEEVRRILSGVAGCLSDAVSEEREDRF
jgi:hypothetical protein